MTMNHFDLSKTITSKAVAADLFSGQGKSTRLIGTHCLGCGSYYFPRSLSCRNPACHQPQPQQVLLSNQGTVYSYTLQSYRPPALFRNDSWQPYLIGCIELANENIRIMGMIGECTIDQIKIGMQVELSTTSLYVDDDGHPVQTYQFIPSQSNETES